MAATPSPAASTKMQAMYHTAYGPPASVLSLQEVDKPVPAADHVLVRVVSASIHAGDWHLIRGDPALIRLIFGGLTKPKINIPGSDFAGVIESLGEGVSDFAVGDEVFGYSKKFGAFAQFLSVPVAGLVKKPASVSFDEASACPTSALTALQALRDVAGIKSGQKVLINGATGGVGMFAVQIAKSFGAETTAVGHKDKLDMLREIGADHVVDYTTTDVTTQRDRMYDVVLDAAAFRSPKLFLPIMNAKGTYVMVGGATANFFGMMFLAPWISVSTNKKAKTVMMETTKEDLLILQDMLASGKIKPFIDCRYNLKDAPEGITRLEKRQVRGKVVIAMNL